MRLRSDQRPCSADWTGDTYEMTRIHYHKKVVAPSGQFFAPGYPGPYTICSPCPYTTQRCQDAEKIKRIRSSCELLDFASSAFFQRISRSASLHSPKVSTANAASAITTCIAVTPPSVGYLCLPSYVTTTSGVTEGPVAPFEKRAKSALFFEHRRMAWIMHYRYLASSVVRDFHEHEYCSLRYWQ